MKKIFLTAIVALILSSCTQKQPTDKNAQSDTRTTDINEVYMRWAGTNPPAEIHLEKAQYWQSAHFTKEYIMYLKLKPDAEWWRQFIEQNKLHQTSGAWNNSKDTPEWFSPSENSIQHYKEEFDQGSRYFRDTLTGDCFIFEVQL